MNTTNPNLLRIAGIGGGVSGLTAANRLRELRPAWKIDLFELSDQLGGVLQTRFDSGYLIEQAADNFLRGPTAPWAESLCERIGFADQLIETQVQHRGAKVFWNDRLYAVPQGFQLIAPSPAYKSAKRKARARSNGRCGSAKPK